MKRYRIKLLKFARGSICIFLSLCMLPVLTLAGMLVDAAKLQAARVNISGASELASNAALSYYDRTLYELYGLFAISEDMQSLEENVSKYYRETLEGYGIFESGDAFTREFINSVFGIISEDTAGFSNVLDICADRFELEGITGSSPANPNVLEKQIIEYMKYKAPIELGKGIISKISCISEISLQTKAAENKLQCEKEFSKSEDSAGDVYDEICEFNKCLKETSFGKEKSGNVSDSFNKSIETAVNYYRFLSEYLVIFNSIGELKNDTVRFCEEDEQEYSEVCDGMDAPQTVMYLYEKMEYHLNTGNTYDAIDIINKSKTGALGASSGLAEIENNIAKLGLNVQTVKRHKDNLIRAASYADEILRIVRKSGTDVDDDIIDRVKEIRDYPQKSVIYLESVKESCRDEALAFGKNASETLLNVWYLPICECIEHLENAKTAIDCLMDSIENLQDSRTEWKESIDTLSDSSIKSSMYVDYDNTVSAFDIESVQKFRDLTDRELKLMKSIKAGLEGIRYFEKRIASNEKEISKYGNTFEYISKKIKEFGFSSENCVESAKQIMNAYFITFRTDADTFKNIGLIDGSNSESAFFNELEKRCGNKAASADTDNDSKNLKKSLISFADQNTSNPKLSDDIPESLSAVVGGKIAARIDELSGYADLKNDSFTPEIDADADDDETIDAASSMLGNISELLSGLKNIAEFARDDLYVEEYLSGMFSCYTDTVKVKDEKVLSLSGADMSSNVFFGAEIEYILWGNDNPSRNVTNTQALIFGIRFALNSIYAFTSTDTRSAALAAATTIAGWTGFGVPIVENVILVSWALAESAVDLQLLREGKSVALYKSKTTWYLGIGGIKKIGVEAIAAVASAAVDDIFSKIDKTLINESKACIDELENTVNGYIDSGIDNVYEQVQNAIAVPIERLALSLASTGQALDLPTVTSEVKDVLNSIKGVGNGLMGECINLVVDKLISEELQNISSELFSLCESTVSAESTENKINTILYGQNGNGGIIGKLKKKVSSYIEKKVGKYADDCKKDISEQIKKNTGNLKKTIKDRISKYAKGISGDDTGAGVASGDPTAASLFSMNYRDYLKIFIFMNYVKSKNTMLKRAAELIQINVSENGNSKDFDITKAYTAISCFSSGNVATLFLGSYKEMNVSDSDTTSGYSKVKKITYSAVYGY